MIGRPFSAEVNADCCVARVSSALWHREVRGSLTQIRAFPDDTVVHIRSASGDADRLALGNRQASRLIPQDNAIDNSTPSSPLGTA